MPPRDAQGAQAPKRQPRRQPRGNSITALTKAVAKAVPPPAPARPQPAPRTDVQSSGGNYGKPQAQHFEHGPVFKHAIRQVFDAQPPARQRELVKTATAHPDHPTSQAILEHVAALPGTPFGKFQGNEPLAPLFRARTQASADVAKGSGWSGGTLGELARIGAHINPTPKDAPKKTPGLGLLATSFGPLGIAKSLAHGDLAGAVAAANPVAPIFKVLHPTGTILQHGAQDAVDIPAETVPSTYDVAKTAIHDPGKAAKMLAEPYIQTAKDPIGSFLAHPLQTYLLAEGVRGGIGRTAGRAMRAAPEGSLPQRLASTERASATLPGTSLEQIRRYSPDVTRKAIQAAGDVRKTAKAERLRAKAHDVAAAGDPEAAQALAEKANRVDPTRINPSEVRRRMDERQDVNEQVRRMHRADVTNQADEIIGKQKGAALSLATQRIAQPTVEDLRAYRDELAAEYPTLKRATLQQANAKLRAQIDEALKKPGKLAGVQEAADAYQQLVGPMSAKLGEIGVYAPEQVDMAPLVGYAARQMGARFDYAEGGLVTHRPIAEAEREARVAQLVAQRDQLTAPRDVQATRERLDQAVRERARQEQTHQDSLAGFGVARGRAQVLSRNVGGTAAEQRAQALTVLEGKQQFAGGGRGVADAAQALRASAGNLSKARQAVADAQAAHESMVSLAREQRPLINEFNRRIEATKNLEHEVIPLSPDAIRAHMAEQGVGEPAFVTQAPHARNGYFVPQHEAPSVPKGTRTGEATLKGTFDASPETLREGAARMQGLVDAHEGFGRMVGEFGLRGEHGDVQTFGERGDAVKVADELTARGEGRWRPIRVQPFAGRSAQLHDLLEQTSSEGQPEHESIRDAITAAIGKDANGPGPWAIVPDEAADQLSQHIRVLGSGGAGKAFQLGNSLFRRAVLATSPKWLTGNTVEAGVRAAVDKAGPRSWYTGRQVLKTLEKSDPQAAEELAARAVGGGHYSMADRMPRRGYEQFQGTRLEPVANALHAFWEAPGPKQAADLWHHWTDLVFHKLNAPIERQFQTAMAGAHIRRTLMDGKMLKTSQTAIEDAANGLTNTNAQVDLARAVDRAYGRYSKMSPGERRVVMLYTPFLAWARNALQFVGHVLPRDHPVLTSAIASAHAASADWRKSHGLDLFTKGSAPAFLQGSIPVGGGGKVRLSRYTPFGLFDDLPGTAGGEVLPQLSGTLSGLQGQEWTGRPLPGISNRPADPFPKTGAAALALVEATVPLAGQADQYLHATGNPIQRLRKVYDPFAASRAKPKQSRGGRRTSTRKGVILGGGGSFGGGSKVILGGGGSFGDGSKVILGGG